MVQRASRLQPMQRHVDALRVGEIDVRPAVAIVIDQRHSPAHRLRNELGFRTRLVIEDDSRRFCDVDELRIIGHRPRRRALRLGFLALCRRQRRGRPHLRGHYYRDSKKRKRNNDPKHHAPRSHSPSDFVPPANPSVDPLHFFTCGSSSGFSSARISSGWINRSLYVARSFSFISLYFW